MKFWFEYDAVLLYMFRVWMALEFLELFDPMFAGRDDVSVCGGMGQSFVEDTV